MDDEIALRPVREEDFGVLDRHLTDPEAMGAFQWYGWRDPHRWRRRWAENGMLDDDGGHVMVVRGGTALGFVAWRKIVTSMSSFCWNIGVALLPEYQGQGYGTAAHRLLV